MGVLEGCLFFVVSFTSSQLHLHCYTKAKADGLMIPWNFATMKGYLPMILTGIMEERGEIEIE